jgi:hypothetical protein
MNLLMITLLYIAPQTGLDCDYAVPSAAQYFQLALTASSSAPAIAHTTASRDRGALSVAANHSDSGGASNDPDLLFYLDSHARALSESGAPGISPWVQLHPFGAVDGVTESRLPAGDDEQSPAGHHGQVQQFGNSNACS